MNDNKKTADEMVWKDENGNTVTLHQLVQAVYQTIAKEEHAKQMTLSKAKALIEAVEKKAEEQGTRAVLSVCNAQGNPVAVHVMDGAFLVSFDAAVKKAYSAAAVRMPTLELAKIAAPGETFYGVDKLDQGRITVIGGGVPLMYGDVLCGAIGVSGGTGEEDHALAAEAADIFQSLCMNAE